MRPRVLSSIPFDAAQARTALLSTSTKEVVVVVVGAADGGDAAGRRLRTARA
jgi:hypothetical protein